MANSVSTETNCDGLTYKQWYDKVNAYVMNVAELGIDDLSDGPSWDSWNAGETPEDYAREMLEENGFPFDDE